MRLHPGSFSEAPQTLRDIWNLLRDYRTTVELLDGYGESLNGKTKISADWFCSREQVFDVAVLPGEPSS